MDTQRNAIGKESALGHGALLLCALRLHSNDLVGKLGSIKSGAALLKKRAENVHC